MIIKKNNDEKHFKLGIGNTYLVISDDTVTKEELNSGIFKPQLSLSNLELVAATLNFNKNFYLAEDDKGNIHTVPLLTGNLFGLDKLPEIEGIDKYFELCEKQFEEMVDDK